MTGSPCRPATPGDIPTILGFIRDLAALEGRPGAVTATGPDLLSLLFGPRRVAEAVVLAGPAHGTPVGYAWFYFTSATFVGKPVLYLEDLFITTEWRGRGLGLRAMRWLARTAIERGCARMEWSAVENNVDAHRFYENLGANRKSGSVSYMIYGDALGHLAE